MTNTITKITYGGDDYIVGGSNITTISVTLTTAGWSSSTQTVTATGVTTTNAVIVSPDPSDYSDYTDAEIYCSAQGTNSLTFVCGTIPSNDIDVNVIIIS